MGCRAVPTPVDEVNNPDFTPLVKSSETVGKYIKPGSIVVFESTVYPGATEEICIPIIEKISGLKWKSCGNQRSYRIVRTLIDSGTVHIMCFTNYRERKL